MSRIYTDSELVSIFEYKLNLFCNLVYDLSEGRINRFRLLLIRLISSDINKSTFEFIIECNSNVSFLENKDIFDYVRDVLRKLSNDDYFDIGLFRNLDFISDYMERGYISYPYAGIIIDMDDIIDDRIKELEGLLRIKNCDYVCISKDKIEDKMEAMN